MYRFQSRTACVKIIALLLALIVSMAFMTQSAIPVAAQTISEMQQEVANLQEQQQQINDKLDALKEQKNTEQERYNEYTTAIDNIKAQIAVYQSQVDQLNAEIAQKDAEIAQKNQEIEVKNQEIEVKNQEIDQKQADLDQSFEEFKDRVNVMYKRSRSSSSLGVLFGSESFTGFLTQAKVLQNISERDNAVMDYLNLQKAELENLKNQLQIARDEITAAKADIEVKKAEIESKKTDIIAVQNSEQEKANEITILQNESAEVLTTLQAQQREEQSNYDELDEQREKMIAAIIAEQERIRQEEEAKNGPPTISTGSGWLWPTPSYSYVSQKYHSGHSGIDIAAAAGKNIVASRGGKVIFAGFGSAANGFNRYGNVVLLSHLDGYYTLYAHCSSLNVSTGQTVSQGQVIAYVGNTGQSFGNHLHFEVRNGVQGSRLNPFNFVSEP